VDNDPRTSSVEFGEAVPMPTCAREERLKRQAVKNVIALFIEKRI
jgi:hypothetical protein